MAEAALKKLEDHLSCLVCLDTYIDPKQLQCHHVFCHQCLVPLVVRDQQGQLILSCPTCRQVTPVPTSGVAGLQSAFQTSKLLEIVEEHKKISTSVAANTDKAENGSANTPIGETTTCCHEHDGKEVDLYCATCEEPICLKCVVKSGKHFSHETELLGEAFERYKCYAIGKGIEAAVVGEKSTAILKTFDSLGQSCERHIMSSECTCKLVSEITGIIASGSVESRGRGQYEISYQPIIKGRHKLHVKVEGQHIRGSPFSVHVVAKLPVEKLSNPILTIGGVKAPHDVVITQQGNVVVTEGAKDCISVFSPSGDRLRSFGSHGSGLGQFDCPYGVTVDCDGNILVADTGNCRIQKFTAEGHFLTAVGIKGGMQPWAIAYNHINSKFYVLAVNDSIQILNSDFSYSSTFGKRGTSGKGQLHNAYSLTCDCSGNVYVANTENHHIQVFTAEGKFLNIIGRRGNGRGQLESPRGIAVDTSSMVYVSDYGNDRVSVFTSKGEFVTSFGERGIGYEQGKFRDPEGLAVDITGVIYVCDSSNNRIQVF